MIYNFVSVIFSYISMASQANISAIIYHFQPGISESSQFSPEIGQNLDLASDKDLPLVGSL